MESKLICHIFPLIIKLNQAKNNFYIIINNSTYEFSYNNNKDFIPIFSFNDYNKILIGLGTKLQFGDISELPPKEQKKKCFEFSPESTTIEDLYKDGLMFCYLTEKCIEEKITKKKG